MKTILLLIIATIFSINLFAQNFVVSLKGDTTYFKNDIEVKYKQSYKWKEFKADGVTYAVSKIKSLKLGYDFYVSASRHLWKRVIDGKIEVFALRDIDTIPNRVDNLTKNVLIKKGDSRLLDFSNKNLLYLIEEDTLIYDEIIGKVAMSKAGIGTAIGGGVITGLSGISLLLTGFYALIDNKNDYSKQASIATAGLIVGAGTLTTGLILNADSRKKSLYPIYYYNSK